MKNLKLTQVPDTNSFNIFGPDPFKLLQVEGKQEALPDLPELLNLHQTGVQIMPSNGYEHNNHLIPNHSHFIYQVNPLRNPDHLQTIARFKRLYESYNVILWVNFYCYSAEELHHLKETCIQNQVHLMDCAVIDGYMGEVEPMYKLELLRGNYAASTDTFRIELLSRWGGWYMDTDVLSLDDPERLIDVVSPTGLYLHKGPVKFIERNIHPLHHKHKKSDDTGIICSFDESDDEDDLDAKFKYDLIQNNQNNDFIMATRRHQFIEKVKAQIVENYKTSAKDLFGEEELKKYRELAEYSYSQLNDRYGLSTSDFVLNWTIFCTGPTVFRNIHHEDSDLNYHGTPKNEGPVPLDFFHFACEISWKNQLNKKDTQIADEDAIKIAITGLLIDLLREPRYLRLDRYAPLLTEARAYTVLKTIDQYYPDSFAKVRKIYSCGYDNVFAELKAENSHFLPEYPKPSQSVGSISGHISPFFSPKPVNKSMDKSAEEAKVHVSTSSVSCTRQ
ncbi:Mannosyltransferase OCH1 [Legionella massiliensis]|uniref:Mannosyltransferase OCH1 n=1 Tax=Legionella massiliensis TaxID=1034943 RepID=A0A078KUH2_9GAMM|nr:TcdA/TcdB catalytic glycosyltransferase domain-containing protein [Legionella massiliensis]CDZ76652.1 Mannosyltransferase OCH1 [Legionella massiliensis]CEE12390.1 TcdA/TcdB catalytic glycosyltransferase domain protein [Legionella massiliensis]